jgi:hypothetical protein
LLEHSIKFTLRQGLQNNLLKVVVEREVHLP